MLGDVEKEIENENQLEKQANDLKLQCLALLSQQDKAREIRKEIYQKYGKIIKIRSIYAKPKGYKNEYYQITIEQEER